jgi:hypothetical protein
MPGKTKDTEYGLLELIRDCICSVPEALEKYERLFGRPFKHKKGAGRWHL